MNYEKASNRSQGRQGRNRPARWLSRLLILATLLLSACDPDEITLPDFDIKYYLFNGTGGLLQFQTSIFTDMTPLPTDRAPKLDIYLMGTNAEYEGEYPVIFHETIPLSEAIQLSVRDLPFDIEFDLVFAGDVEPMKLTAKSVDNIYGLRYAYLFGMPAVAVPQFQVYSKRLPNADELTTTMKQMGLQVTGVTSLDGESDDPTVWRISVDYGEAPDRELFGRLILKRDVEDIIFPRLIGFEKQAVSAP